MDILFEYPNKKPSGTKKRNTLQRSLVLAAMLHLANHPSADDVYDDVRKAHPEISKATVYRNLNGLVEEGVLRRICVANAADRFDHNTQQHYHIRCNSCGYFGDIELEYFHGLDEKVEQITGYTLENHDIVFEGICPVCKKCNKTI